MYRVIVVDDESEIREGIINKIPWAELGFEVVGSAENGIEALELVETLQPDLVMSDIKIPFMDGLTLAEHIRDISLPTKVIIFSGFDDFDYAKRAIRLNVVEYIMKPISAVELSRTLRKLKEDLDAERASKRDLERMQSLFEASVPVMRDQFIQELLEGRSDEEKLKARAELLRLDIFAGRPLAVMVYIGFSENIEASSPLVSFSLQQSIDEMLGPKYALNSFVRGDHILLFVALKDSKDALNLIRDLNSLCRFAHVILLRDINAGVSKPAGDYRSMSKAYQEAFTAYSHSLASGRQQALSISDIEPTKARPFPFSYDDWRVLSQAISMKSPGEVDAELDALFVRLGQLSWHKRQLEELCLEFLTHFLQLIRSYDLEVETVFDPTQNYLSQAEQCRTLFDLEKWCRRISKRISAAIGDIRQSSAERLAEQAKAYVALHFQESDLSVDAICQELHVSPAYFSTVFKKQTGQSFVSFLTDTRMQEAKRLLETSDDRTYMITGKVGYSDPNYFSYAFKKHFGISPTQYRKNLQSKAGSAE